MVTRKRLKKSGKKYVFIKEPFGLPFELQPKDKFKAPKKKYPEGYKGQHRGYLGQGVYD
jgi:hypothetical protein